MQQIDISNKPSPHSLRNKVARMLWGIVYVLLFRPSPKICHGYRRFMLRLFGARIGRGAHPHPSCRIFAPWNLTMGDHSTLGPYVDCCCVAPIRIGSHTTISQYSYLCGATHDYEDAHFTLNSSPIVIGEQVWIAADVFIGPGVSIGDGAVVGARSSVFKDVPPWTVVVGSPARYLKDRVIQ